MPNRKQQKKIVYHAAKKAGIKPRLLWGVYGQETNFGALKNNSSAGAQGPFQFMPDTARSMGVNPNKFKSAARGAARYLAQYKNRGTKGMLIAYNAGPASSGNNPETRAYVPGVRRHAKSWDYKGGGGGGGGKKGGGGKGGGRAPSKVGGSRITMPGQLMRTGATPSSFDKKGYDEASARQLVAQMIARRRGTDSPMFRTGLLSLDPVHPGDFMIEGDRGQLTRGKQTVSKIGSTKVGGTKGDKGGKGKGGGKGKAHLGGGWGGTQKAAHGAVSLAKKNGIPINSRKRSSTLGNPDSDHYVGNKNAYAVDLGIMDGAKARKVAKDIAKFYGVTFRHNSYSSGGTTKIDGKRVRIQILLGAQIDHNDHIHVGFRLA